MTRIDVLDNPRAQVEHASWSCVSDRGDTRYSSRWSPRAILCQLALIDFFVLFYKALTMRLTLAIQLLALPACLRAAFVVASSDEPPSTRSGGDPLDQVVLTDACPDFAHYSRVRQYGRRSKADAGSPDAKHTIANHTAKALYHYLSKDPSRPAEHSPLPQSRRL
jgi:hypothetical protein